MGKKILLLFHCDLCRHIDHDLCFCYLLKIWAICLFVDSFFFFFREKGVLFKRCEKSCLATVIFICKGRICFVCDFLCRNASKQTEKHTNKGGYALKYPNQMEAMLSQIGGPAGSIVVVWELVSVTREKQQSVLIDIEYTE